MVTVLGCILYEHNIWLVLVAALVCAAGSWATIRLFHRAIGTFGSLHAGWQFLTAVAAGSSIWCTHFIAMLAYDPGAPVGFDPLLTVVSLLIAIAGTSIGFVAAASGITRLAPLLGGGIVGLAISAMHYTGMLAYRVDGLVSWDMAYLVASILLAVTFSAVALHFAHRQRQNGDKFLATGILVLAIVSLHFTAMTAFQVSPLVIHGAYTNPSALQALALAVAAAALIIVGAGLASYLIDDHLRAEAHEKMRRLALNDSLTGLPNRAGLTTHIDHEVYLAQETSGRFALICLDLKGFRSVNSLHGHDGGDQLLRTLAGRMSGILREGEFVARLGADEFAATHRIRSDADLAGFLSRLEAALASPVSLDDQDVVVGASFGVAFYPDNAEGKEALMTNAGLALDRARADMTRSVCFYDQGMDESVRARRALAGDLRKALDSEQLDIHYQVQTAVASGEIRGYEALLRWNHPTRGPISPGEFIPLAEESGLILELGEWVLRKACADAATWNQPCKVAVNLSPVQFAHACLPSLVRETLHDTGLPASRLELELTESTLVADRIRSLRQMHQIKALGVTIALDDFGTGYSSLDTLRTFPFDKIKLDRSFVHEVDVSPQAKAIIRAVLALGKSLSIPVLAEGIETEAQLSVLNEEGCDEGQGYLFGRPASHAEISVGEPENRPTAKPKDRAMPQPALARRKKPLSNPLPNPQNA